MENKAVIFARVSTNRQEQEGLSLDLQINRLREYCKNKGMVIDKEYVFHESADKKKRTKFHEMIEYIQKHDEVKNLVAYRIDRLTRNSRDALLIEDLTSIYKKEVHIVDDRMVLKPESEGRDVTDWDLKTLFAKITINRLRDDARRAKMNKVEKGELPGPAPYGYMNTIKDGNIKWKWVAPKEPQATIVKRIYDMYKTGVISMDEIVKSIKEQFGVNMYKSKVQEILTRKFYHGYIEYKGQEYPHIYKTLITKETYRRVQEIMQGFNKKHVSYAGKPYIYRGMIKCAICGCSITAEIHKGHTYYRCTGYKGRHSSKWAREEILTKSFVDIFNGLIMPEEIKDDILNKLKVANNEKMEYNESVFNSLTAELKRYRARISTMYDDKLDRIITEEEFIERRSRYNEEIEKIENKLKQLNTSEKKFYNIADIILSFTQGAGRIFESSKLDQKRQLINMVLSNLTLNNQELRYTVKKPFDVILKSNECRVWLPVYYTFLNLSTAFDTDLSNIESVFSTVGISLKYNSIDENTPREYTSL